MSLKSRYAAFFLLVLVLLALFCGAAVQLFLMGRYLAGIVLLLALYAVTYFLGRKFARIFFVLSVLKLLRKNGGLLSLAAYNGYIEAFLGTRRKSAEKERMKEEILAMMAEAGLIDIDGDTILLRD